MDETLARAIQTLGPAHRNALYRRATRVAMEEVAIVPLHVQANIWAARRGLSYNARHDERSMAKELRPAPP